MLEAKFKAKIEAMQIYVPLLEKLIAKIEAKNEKNEENVEKISQLKKLLQQLLDPKPSISFEELNECHQVMENLFKANKRNDNSKLNEQQKMSEKTQDQQEQRNITAETQTLKVQKTLIAENSSKSNIEALSDSSEKVENYRKDENDKDINKENESKTQAKENSNGNSKEEQQNDDDKEIDDCQNDADDEIKNMSIASSNELENVEVIEFSADESDASSEGEEELILPDNEIEETLRKSNSKDDEEVDSDMETSVHKNSHKDEENYENVPKNVRADEPMIELDTINELRQDTTKKRPNDTSTEILNELAVAKKIRIWDPKQNMDDDEALKVNLAENTLDPLADQVGEQHSDKNSNTTKKAQSSNENNQNEQNEVLNMKEHESEITTAAEQNPDDDDDDDEIQIIETRQSPILIDSDDDDGDCDATSQAIIPQAKEKVESVPKNPPSHSSSFIVKKHLAMNERRIFATKKAMEIHKLQTQLARKNKPQFSQPSSSSSSSSSKSSTTAKSSKTATIDNLKPKMTTGPNPQLFSTKIGNRDLLIPNAFYGTNKTNSNQNSNSQDIAHCRWLENFLQHFCSPYNIAHNTCFLLLQRALRENDFLVVRQRHSLLNVTHGDVDDELLQILRRIFYLNGDPVASKLTFIGRKFCNLAFVNVLDKTISLTVDWRTNAVTSRTRISTATLEAVRKETPPLTQTNSAAAAAFPTAIVYPNQITTPAKTISNKPAQVTENCLSTPTEIPATMIRMPKKNKSAETAVKKVNPEKLTPNESECDTVTLRRSSRNVKKNEEVESTKRFIYSTDDDEDDNDDVDKDREFLSIKADNKKTVSLTTLNVHGEVDVSAALEDFISTQTKQKTSTYEMAFLAQLANEGKDTCGRVEKQKQPSQTSSNDVQTIVLDDDDQDDDEDEKTAVMAPRYAVLKPTRSKKTAVATADPETTIKLPLEPRLLKIKQEKQRPKNINPNINFKDKFKDTCMICNNNVKHIVAHYVNVHPDCEVYVSRPTPTYTDALRNKQLPLAQFDRQRNSYPMFLSTCVFCEKKASFTLSYWHQHFASHTGEYAFKCSGCGVRKPTRSHLLLHLKACMQKGSRVVHIEKEEYDGFSSKISAYMCSICNYTQMNSENIINHIRNEHGLARLGKKLYSQVDLLTASEQQQSPKQSKKLSPNAAAIPPIIIRNSVGDVFEVAEIENGNSYALPLKVNVEPSPFVVDEAEHNNLNNTNLDDIGDYESVLQAYINRKEF